MHKYDEIIFQTYFKLSKNAKRNRKISSKYRVVFGEQMWSTLDFSKKIDKSLMQACLLIQKIPISINDSTPLDLGMNMGIHLKCFTNRVSRFLSQLVELNSEGGFLIFIPLRLVFSRDSKLTSALCFKK